MALNVLLTTLKSASLLAAVAVQSANLAATLRSTAAVYYREAGHVAAVAGRDTTMDYYDRLIDDADLFVRPAPQRYPSAFWERAVRAVSELDLSLATQLLDRRFTPMSAIRGPGETFVRSSKDGTMQPVAVYVPTQYSPSKPAALMLFLHGKDQPESNLVAAPYLQDLAESTGTIVVAPYGRGAYDFRGTESDVYDAFDAANHAFAIAAGKRYFAGYSMGGFSVFRLAPMRPGDWNAIVSIAGALLASRSAHLLTAMPENVRYYLLTGAEDGNVPTAFPTATAIFLRDAGRAVTFYSQPDGTHDLYTLRPIIARAWDDLERGVVRSPYGLTGAPDLPGDVAPP